MATFSLSVTSIGVTSSTLLVGVVTGGRSTDIIPLLGLFLGGGTGLVSTDPLDDGDRVPLTTLSATVALVGLGCEDVDALEDDFVGLVGVGKSSIEYSVREIKYNYYYIILYSTYMTHDETVCTKPQH